MKDESMVKVKICGISTEEGIQYLNKYLPDYAGFVFAKSRRQVSVEVAKRLIENLDVSIKRVGVFVNMSSDEILSIVDICGLDVVQIHGDENPEFINSLRDVLNTNVEIWKAIRVKDNTSFNEINVFKADRIILDTFSENSYGGEGKKFEWDLAKDIGENTSIILAGGLDKSNVAKAIEVVKPFAVDVSSGVETDGVKDEIKIRDFIYEARRAN